MLKNEEIKTYILYLHCSNDEMLGLYALYKQATGIYIVKLNKSIQLISNYDYKSIDMYCVYSIHIFTVGDCNIEQPGVTEIKARAKWDAWNKKKGVNQDEAKTQYIELAKTMIEKHGRSS